MSIRARAEALLTAPRLPLWVALGAVLLALPSLAGGFMLDDHGLAWLVDSGVPSWDLFAFWRWGSVPELQERGFSSWWTSPDFHIGFMRPISSVGHALDFTLWPRAAWAMHAHSALLYGALCGLTALLYRRLGMPLLAAGIAALLFAVDDVHAQTAGWISGRNAIVAAIPAFAALWAHHRWRTQDWRHGAWLGPLLLALSLVSAEAGLACAGYLAAHALCLDGARWWRRLLALAPYGAVLAVWQLAYRALGYGARGSGIYLDVAAHPLTFLTQSIEHAWVMGLAQLTLPLVTPLSLQPWGWLASALILGLLALAVRPLLQRSALARFFGVGMLLSALPFGATALSDRLLLPLGFGASGLLALIAVAVRRGELTGPFARWTDRGLLLFAGVLSPLLFVPSLFLTAAFERPVQALDALIPSQGVTVVVSVPLDILMLYPEAYRHHSGGAWPDHVYTLHAGQGRLDVNRCGPRCLMLQADQGWLASPLDRIGRAPDEPFHPGWVTGLERMTARVTRLTPDGRPQAVAFLFDDDLDDIHFITWVEGAPQAWQPPALDHTVSLDTRFVLGR